MLDLTSQGSREQLAIAAFAQALLVVPKTLAVNAALDATELVAQLRSRHALSQRATDPPEPSSPGATKSARPAPSATGTASTGTAAAAVVPAGGSPGAVRPGSSGAPDDERAANRRRAYRNYGLDLSRGKVHDVVRAGVLEPAMSKVKQLKSAVEACVAIMRIDTLIKLDPEVRGGEDDGHGH
jgi:T-complex protein 1 subunit alpha